MEERLSPNSLIMSSAEIAAAGIQDVYYFEFPDDGYDEMASPADDNVITPSPTPPTPEPTQEPTPEPTVEPTLVPERLPAGFDTAENEPAKNLQTFNIQFLQNFKLLSTFKKKKQNVC